MKEGLRKYGRAWGKIYREVGGLKTATQCKQFYDKYCSNKQLDLLAALAEHSSMKVVCVRVCVHVCVCVCVRIAYEIFSEQATAPHPHNSTKLQVKDADVIFV